MDIWRKCHCTVTYIIIHCLDEINIYTICLKKLNWLKNTDMHLMYIILKIKIAQGTE